jgi:hypothetical protein
MHILGFQQKINYYETGYYIYDRGKGLCENTIVGLLLACTKWKCVIVHLYSAAIYFLFRVYTFVYFYTFDSMPDV